MAEETRKELEQARAIANTQAKVVDSERKVSIADFEAQAAVKQAGGLAQSKKINAEADAEVIRVTGDAEATKIKAVGTADADVIKLKIASVEAGNYAAIEVSRNLSTSNVPIVPEIVAGGATGGGDNIVSVLLANMLLEGRNGHKNNGDVRLANAVVEKNK
jgi:uncharacterized membrane protein YqiK